MAQRTHYWSCSKFANWLRGTDKPSAATGEGWNTWHKLARKNHSVRYWIAEEALDVIQSTIWWPLDQVYSLKYYINNRWVTRTHALTAHPKDIQPGTWRDVGNRFLPCLFNELVDFVEVEQAWHHIAWDSEARKEFNAPFYSWGWFRWRTWRCPESGLAYLKWSSELTNKEWLADDKKHLAELTSQALAAREILELYNWWKNIYPNRIDPHTASGWSAWCDRRRQKIKEQDPDSDDISFFSMNNESDEDQAETHRILELSQQIENQQNDEDEQMMIRLIKVRGNLWT